MFGGLPDEAAMWEMYELDPEDESQLYKLDTSGWKDPPPGPQRTPWTRPEYTDSSITGDRLFGDEKSLKKWNDYFSEERGEYEMNVLTADSLMEPELEPTFREYTTHKLRTHLGQHGNEEAASLFHWLYKNIQDGTLGQYEGEEKFRDLHGVISDILTGEGMIQEYQGPFAPDDGNYLPGIITIVPELEYLLSPRIDLTGADTTAGLLPGETDRGGGKGTELYLFPDRDTIANHDFQFVSKTKLDPRTRGGVDYLEALIEASSDQRDVFDRAFREAHPTLTGSWFEGQKSGLFIDAMTDRYFSRWDDEATTYQGYAADTPLRSKTPFVADEEWFKSWLYNREEHQTNLFSSVSELANFLHENRWNFEGEDYARAGVGEGVLEGQQYQDMPKGGGMQTEADVDETLAQRLGLDLDNAQDKQRFYQFKAFNPLIHKVGSSAHEGAITAIKQAAISALTPVGASTKARASVAKQINRDYDDFTSSGKGSPLSFLKHALGGGRVISSQSTLPPKQGHLWRETEAERLKRLAGGPTKPILRLPGGQQAALF